jgi:HAMP domain-containing protein
VRIRSKVVLFSLFFALASGAVMAWCFVNIHREEAAFINSRRAIKTFAAVSDIEYFLVRQVRLLESYVLLGDESERLQLVQASAQTRQRLEEWSQTVKKGESHGVEIPAVKAVADAIAVPANKIRGLIALGKRTQAMALVEKEFSPASRQALAKFDAVKRRVQEAKIQSENVVILELQQSHLGLMGGLGLVVFFGLSFLWALYSAVIRPLRNMRTWADRVARGEKGLAMAAFSGKNELTELAQSIGEMAIQLTRPKAYPSPPVAAKTLPVSPAPHVRPSARGAFPHSRAHFRRGSSETDPAPNGFGSSPSARPPFPRRTTSRTPSTNFGIFSPKWPAKSRLPPAKRDNAGHQGKFADPKTHVIIQPQC